MTESSKDAQSHLTISGRFQTIEAHPGQEYERTTLAAGAVLWRGDREAPQFAVIHRPHYDDWSLAKGKVDPGESLPVTAVREISEETGFDVHLSQLLGKVAYPVKGKMKVVYYWLARVESGEFCANSEVDEIRWLSLDHALELLSYEVDQKVLRKASQLLALPSTARILYVRHAQADAAAAIEGPEHARPLSEKGKRQGKALASLLETFAPATAYSAMPARCQQTATIISQELALPFSVVAELGDDGLSGDAPSQAAIEAFKRIVAKGGTSIVVSQGSMMPRMINYLDPGFIGLGVEELRAKKASVWVLTFNDGVLSGADYLASPLAVK